MLRDRLVCGINDAAIQRRLLSESNLTFQSAVDLARGLEAAARDAKELLKPLSVLDQPTPAKLPTVLKVTPPSSESKSSTACHRCGKPGHTAHHCPFKQGKCYNCGKLGHLRKVCRSKPRGSDKRETKHTGIRTVQPQEKPEEQSRLYAVRSAGSVPPLLVPVQIDGLQVVMEVDTGAAYSLVSEATFSELWPTRTLSHSNVKLCSYSGEPIPVLGCLNVSISYNAQQSNESLLVVRGSGPNLFGRDWLKNIKLDWQQINQIRRAPLQAVLDQHEAVFQSGLGELKGYKASILVDPEARPRFCKARSLPYAYREMVDKELDCLVTEGILEPVQYSDWASPIVPVLKSDKQTLRICADFKQTINPCSALDRYPIPKVEDLFASLAGGRMFSKIDLRQAYQQVPLEPESKKYVVINTLKGLFQYTRLPFGISSAPGIFQRLMENILQGLPGVVVYLDDILVAGASEEEHLMRLNQVLSRLEQAGLRAKKEKCQFMVSSITFLGHWIDHEGIHPLPEKIQAVTEAPLPKGVQELKAYLGLLSYYSKFIPNMASTLAPLYHLLKKDVRWQWTKEQEEAFQQSKKLLTASSLLTHFDSKLPLVLACDASSVGIGAVLAHKFPDGSERPIGYASRSLSRSERNYSQLEKEGLSCVFGVKRFHQYILGHHFLLLTDHKPLLALLHEHRSTSSQASARIRRWSLELSAYEYTLEFRDTHSHSNADALSRLPLPVAPVACDDPPEIVLVMEQLSDFPITAHHIRTGTHKDPVLSQVLQYVRRGWPTIGYGESQLPSQLSPFYRRRTELSICQGCLLWGSRIIVPPTHRAAVLEELHDGHPGMTRAKSVARMFVWWPCIDEDIERTVRQCQACQSTRASPPSAPLHPWHWPTRPWARLHMDYAGPIAGKMILIVVDAHSKWIEAYPLSTATSAATIEKLRTMFSQFGLPESLVSDNAAYFTSEELETFVKRNGIRHSTSAAYHPASNGLAERAVQVVKQGLKKIRDGTLEARLAKVLFAYRTTPHATTGRALAELLLGRIPRTRLDLLFPDPASRVEDKQWTQKKTHDRTARPRTFTPGQSVYVRNFPAGDSWISAQVLKSASPVSFIVQLPDGRQVKRHQDHIRSRLPDMEGSHSSEHVADTGNNPLSSSGCDIPLAPVETHSGTAESISPPPRHYPVRQRKPPDRFQHTAYSTR